MKTSPVIAVQRRDPRLERTERAQDFGLGSNSAAAPIGKPLPVATERQAEGLRFLHQLLDELQGRLGPVMGPEVINGAGVDECEKSPNEPGFAEILNRHNRQIEEANGRLRSLIERLQF